MNGVTPAPGVGLNPLSGLPLEAWQALVIGAPETGPRRTVVDTRPGATVPRWISVVGDQATGGRVYLDNGVTGGTYSGPQVLPEVTVRARFLGPLVAVLLVLLAGLIRGRPRARAA